MLVNFMSTYFLPHLLHKVQPFRLTDGSFEVKVIIYCLYVGGQGVGEVGEIVWRGLGYLFMVDQLGCKTSCFRKNGIGVRHGYRREEGNEAKYLGYSISLIVLFLNYFAST